MNKIISSSTSKLKYVNTNIIFLLHNLFQESSSIAEMSCEVQSFAFYRGYRKLLIIVICSTICNRLYMLAASKILSLIALEPKKSFWNHLQTFSEPFPDFITKICRYEILEKVLNQSILKTHDHYLIKFIKKYEAEDTWPHWSIGIYFQKIFVIKFVQTWKNPIACFRDICKLLNKMSTHWLRKCNLVIVYTFSWIHLTPRLHAK